MPTAPLLVEPIKTGELVAKVLTPPVPVIVTDSLSNPAQTLFDAVIEAIRRVLVTPMKDTEIATALDISPAQAKAWLQRLVDAGVVEKKTKPVVYAIKPSDLFG